MGNEGNVDKCDVRSTAEELYELEKNSQLTIDIATNNIELIHAEVTLNDSTQNSDSVFPNGSLEKMSIIDDETKVTPLPARINNDQLDSDDDSEPPVDTGN